MRKIYANKVNSMFNNSKTMRAYMYIKLSKICAIRIHDSELTNYVNALNAKLQHRKTRIYCLNGSIIYKNCKRNQSHV